VLRKVESHDVASRQLSQSTMTAVDWLTPDTPQVAAGAPATSQTPSALVIMTPINWN